MKKANMHSSEDHHRYAEEKGPISLSIITVSDSRTEADDVNGQYLKKVIEHSGNKVAAYHLIKDEPAQVETILKSEAAKDLEIILFNGGTGISRRDTTYDVISRFIEKPLPGFGELFRMLSYEQVGAAAMLSRALAGIYQGKVVIATPGSPAALRLAWEKLIAPEIKHLAWELGR